MTPVPGKSPVAAEEGRSRRQGVKGAPSLGIQQYLHTVLGKNATKSESETLLAVGPDDYDQSQHQEDGMTPPRDSHLSVLHNV